MVTKEDILEKYCPSMNPLYLDDNGRAFKDRIILAMEEYAKQNANGNQLETLVRVRQYLRERKVKWLGFADTYDKKTVQEDKERTNGVLYGIECALDAIEKEILSAP
jgi:hypothetical protein